MPSTPHDPPLNPYEAPQTLDLVVATLADAPVASESLVAPPREVKRWMNAALALYFVSFVVPYAPWIWFENQNWQWGMGAFFGIMGIFFCWHPFFFSWWANVTFWIAYRDLNRVTSGKALIFAIAGVILAPITGIGEWFDPATMQDNKQIEPLFSGPIVTSAPYLCWLGSMVLMLIAAIKLRRFVSRCSPSEAIHD